MTSSGYDYVLYIDEAGDPSIKTRSQGAGSTDWFGLGGIVISKKYEPDLPSWIRNILSDTGHDPIPDEMHFNRLDMERKLATASAVAALPVRAFTVLTHKENMRGYRNHRAERQRSRNWLYNFCLRILLERATQTVARSSRKQFNEVRRLRIVIAQTGGIRYDLTMRYIEKLRAQALTGTTYLNRNVIDHEVASSWQFEAVSARTTAGCQLADAVVSSFYNSVNEAGAFPMYQEAAHALQPIVSRFNGTSANHGLTLLPWDHNIPARFKPIFRHYGYRI